MNKQLATLVFAFGSLATSVANSTASSDSYSAFQAMPPVSVPSVNIPFTVPTQPQFSYDDIPDIGGGIGLLDQQQERKIGEKVFRQVQAQMPILRDVWLEDQLMHTFSNLLAQTQLGEPIALVLVNDRQINAFAVPGGLFAINAGLINNAKNLDEVAGVMAHEIAHVTQRHYSRSTEAFKGQGLLTLAGLIAGALVASQVDPELGTAVMMGTQAGMIDRQLAYSRDQEREADRVGLQYLYRSGFNPESMADFFETMHRSTPRASFLPDFWFTHPLTSERMSEARLRARQLIPLKSAVYDQRDFDILKMRVGVRSGLYTEAQLNVALVSQPYAAKLALAEFHIQRGEYDKAQQMLSAASQIDAQHVVWALLQSRIYLEQNQADKAMALISARHKIMPENRSLNYQLAEIYLRKNQPNAVVQLIRPYTQQQVRDIHAWSLLQRAAELNPDKQLGAIQVLRYRAEVEFWTGQEEQAIKSLLHAQRLAKTAKSESLQASVTTRLKELQIERKLKI